MANEHEIWLERGDIYAVGALDGEELRQFETHLASGCAICAAYVRETRESLMILHRSLAPMTPSPEVKARLLRQIEPEIVTPRSKKPWLSQLSWGLGGGALVAAGLLAFVSWNLVSTRKELAAIRERIGALQSDLAQREEVIAFLTNPQVRVVSLAGLPESPNARGLVLWNADSRAGLFLATGLAQVPAEKIYELWAIADNEPVPAGLFTLDRQGRALLKLAALPADKTFDKFAVTVEPAGGVPKPTGPMHLLGSL